MKTFLILLFVPAIAFAKLVSTQNVLLSPSVSAFPPGVVTAGGDSFGGGDTFDSRLSMAWFYGGHPIKTCFHITAGFGLSETEAKGQIETAIESWKTYLSDKKFGHELKEKDRINYNFQLKSKCSGGEDLVLYLGTGPIFGNLSDMRARQFLSRPVAYVNKTHIRDDYRWAKGYIRFVEPAQYQWLAGDFFPKWDGPSNFYNILLHDLGHVLGFQHIPNTIMDKEIAEKTFRASKGVLEIDWGAELFSCQSCDMKFVSTDSPFNELTITSDEKVMFLKGEKRLEPHVVRIKKGSGVMSPLSFFNAEYYTSTPIRLIYLDLDGEALTLELEEGKASLVKNGKVIAEFSQVRGVR